jgi:hypothetical protein
MPNSLFLGKRHVAMVDILGFKALLSSKPLLEIVSRVEALLKYVRGARMFWSSSTIGRQATSCAAGLRRRAGPVAQPQRAVPKAEIVEAVIGKWKQMKLRSIGFWADKKSVRSFDEYKDVPQHMTTSQASLHTRRGSGACRASTTFDRTITSPMPMIAAGPIAS